MSESTSTKSHAGPADKPDSATTILIYRTEGDNFTIVPNDTIGDKRLSWRAKGILTYLVGKPKDWEVQITDIRKHGKEGERAIRASLMELRRVGYASLRAIRKDRRIASWKWLISDRAIFNPTEDSLLGRNEHLQNAHLTKKEVTKTYLLKHGKVRKPRSEAQKAAFRKFNHVSDHRHYDPQRDDVPGMSPEQYRDEMHDAKTGVKGARTIPRKETP